MPISSFPNGYTLHSAKFTTGTPTHTTHTPEARVRSNTRPASHSRTNCTPDLDTGTSTLEVDAQVVDIDAGEGEHHLAEAEEHDQGAAGDEAGLGGGYLA